MSARVRFSAAVVAGVLQSCAAEPADSSEDLMPEEAALLFAHSDSELSAFFSETWLGRRLGLPAPRVTDLGSLSQLIPGTWRHDVVAAKLAEPPARGFERIVAAREGKQYLLELPVSAELEAKVSERLDAQLDEAYAETADLLATTAGSSDKGIIGSSDDRKRFGIYEGFSRDDWVATIGAITPTSDSSFAFCSGTLISPDVVLTAAHCLFEETSTGGFRFSNMNFYPRADRTQAELFPWGRFGWTNTAYYDDQYLANGCYRNALSKEDDARCRPYDWALVRFSRPVEADAFKLFMRVKVVSTQDMTGLKNRGYPACGEAESPPNCISHTLFGDPAECTIGITGNTTDTDGVRSYSETATHTCDTNHGHSGSPIYFYDPQNSNRPTIVGVHIAMGVSRAGFDSGNWMRHITPSVLSKINQVLSGSASPI